MSFYDRKGVDSWSQGIVPHFITSNAFIGRSYANVLKGFFGDVMKAGSDTGMECDVNEPFYIIELGTGSGKFSYFMLKALNELSATLNFPVENIVYVMTDFTQTNFDFWTTHPALAPYVASGQLDFAIFDAVNGTSLSLHNSKKTIDLTNKTANPICVVANYLFDTLCHDIFQVDRGELMEGLISVGSKRGVEEDPLDPEIIKNFDNTFTYVPTTSSYYSEIGTEDPADHIHLKRILSWYLDFFSAPENDKETNLSIANNNISSSTLGASLLIPIGTFRALRRLTNLSSGRAIVISGDKGNNSPSQFRGLLDPHIAVHGSFSVMVNYHAVGAYFTSRGGFALHNPQEEASLKVSAFVLTGRDNVGAGEGKEGIFNMEGLKRLDEERLRKFPILHQAFTDNVDSFGPNDFFVMQKCLKEDAPTPTLKSVVALLKLGDWDPDVFYKFRDTILNQIGSSGYKLKNDLLRGVPRVWKNYYLLDREKDVAFEIGRFYYGIRQYADAVKYYTVSSDTIGQHHVTFHNMGLCYYSMGQPERSIHYFEQAIGLNDKYEKAVSWLTKVKLEIETASKKEKEKEKEKEGGGLPPTPT
ncbi:hypothetical protein ScalyP_jg792 [Parmales sp. scaly parma]|nr:hypothetical protein ScalyP_jg792 [Parmales sp. scaly parma]